jgi:hypothetical protein
MVVKSKRSQGGKGQPEWVPLVVVVGCPRTSGKGVLLAAALRVEGRRMEGVREAAPPSHERRVERASMSQRFGGSARLAGKAPVRSVVF